MFVILDSSFNELRHKLTKNNLRNIKRTEILFFLQFDHFGNELGMVREISVHNDDKITLGVFNAMNIGRSQA